MKESPILMPGPMVRAILDDRKTMTRRVIKPQPEMEMHGEILPDGTGGYSWEPVLPPWPKRPYQIGQRIWVRETWCLGEIVGAGIGAWYVAEGKCPIYREYAESNGIACDKVKWRPSIFMPRWMSRITLEITGVRAERLQDISEEDAKAEGVEAISIKTLGWRRRELNGEPPDLSYAAAFATLWDSINGKRYPWESNPWVWAVEFRRIK